MPVAQAEEVGDGQDVKASRHRAVTLGDQHLVVRIAIGDCLEHGPGVGVGDFVRRAPFRQRTFAQARGKGGQCGAVRGSRGAQGKVRHRCHNSTFARAVSLVLASLPASP